jgi:DNA-binding transcriptional MerR regulator
VGQAIPLRKAARELGINPSRVKQQVEKGILRQYGEWKEAPGWHKLIVKEDVLELKNQSEALLSLKEAAYELGVTVNFMRTLSKSGLIEPETGHHVLGRRGTVFSREEIERFWGSVASSAKLIAEGKDGFVDLFHAARILTVVGVNSVGILRLLQNREISAYLLRDQQAVSGLRFDEDELMEYIDKVRSERGWLTRSDVAERFEVSLRRVSQWISEGNLKVDLTFGTTKYFYQDQVKDFASQLVGNGAIY